MNARCRIIALIAALWLSPALAVEADNRIKWLMYDENDVYTIAAKYGYQTNVVFSSTEDIETISMGDRTLWQIIPAGNRLFIRPMAEDVTTNMTVITNKRAYQFDLKSVPLDAKNTDIVYVAKFVYDNQWPKEATPLPPPPPPPGTPPMPPPAPKETAAQPNYDYTYSGPDTLAPLQVFDNGTFTFVKYLAVPDPLPEVVMISAPGVSRKVTPEVKDKLLILPGVASTVTLTHKNGTVTVYNETLNPR